MFILSKVICAGSLLWTTASSSASAGEREGLAVEENRALPLLLSFLAEKRDVCNCCCLRAEALENRTADAEALQLLLLAVLPTAACEEQDRRASNRTLVVILVLLTEPHSCWWPCKS